MTATIIPGLHSRNRYVANRMDRLTVGDVSRFAGQ